MTIHNTNKPQTLTRRRSQILDLLRERPRSITQLTKLTGFCDPRSYIRYLRDMGYPIIDYWQSGKDKTRYKVYFCQPQHLNTGSDE